MRLIFDGNFMAHRARHTTGKLRNGISYGMLKSMHTAVKRFEPTDIVWVFDGSLSKTRKELLPEYKHGRGEIDPFFISQVEWFNEGLLNMGIKQIRFPDCEADDVIGVIANLGPSVIVSSDTDFLQLVTKDISVFNPIKGELYDYDNVKESLGGEEPHRYIETKAICGDKADNIDGFRGLGWKASLQFIHTVHEEASLPHPDLTGKLSVINEPESILKLQRNIALITIPTELSQIDSPHIEQYSEEIGNLQKTWTQDWNGWVNWLSKARFNSILSKLDDWEKQYKR